MPSHRALGESQGRLWSCTAWPSTASSSPGTICSLKTAHRLRLCIAFSMAFPGYLVAAFDIFCCISVHARWVALPLVRSIVGLFDCARLPEPRGSAGLGFGTAFADDVACGWGECLRWPPAAYSVRSPVFGDVNRSCLFARDASARATISRRRAARELGFRRAFSSANSSGCCVAMCALSPAAW